MPTSVKTSPKTVTTPDGEEVVQHVDVRGDARHQPADGVAVVVAQIEPLQVAVDRHAQVEHDPLPGQLHRPGLDVFGGECADQDRQIQRGEPVEPGEAADGDVAVDRDLDEIRLRERCGGADDDRDERERDLSASTAAGTAAAAASAGRRRPCRGCRRPASLMGGAPASPSSRS